jgi:hypothetical protein
MDWFARSIRWEAPFVSNSAEWWDYLNANRRKVVWQAMKANSIAPYRRAEFVR